MRFMGLLLRNHLHRVFLINDDHLGGSSRWRRYRGWHSSRGCGSISSIIIVLIIAVVSLLVGELHDELVVRLDHSFHLGLLLSQLLGVFPQLLALGLQLRDLLASFLSMLAQ
jgi:hypothetical protein